jgi:hypothetical protein
MQPSYGVRFHRLTDCMNGTEKWRIMVSPLSSVSYLGLTREQ